MAKIKTFNLNEDVHQYDDNVVNLEMGNLAEVSRLTGGLISIPLGSSIPHASESVEAPRILDVEAEISWEVLKVQLTLNQQAWVPHHMLFLHWHFFVVNDGKKPNPLTIQTICYLIYQFVY
jgi:hypothetical protein